MVSRTIHYQRHASDGSSSWHRDIYALGVCKLASIR
jgi:hypothetical protein